MAFTKAKKVSEALSERLDRSYERIVVIHGGGLFIATFSKLGKWKADIVVRRLVGKKCTIGAWRSTKTFLLSTMQPAETVALNPQHNERTPVRQLCKDRNAERSQMMVFADETSKASKTRMRNDESGCERPREREMISS